MPKYLALFKYSENDAKGFMKEKAAAREAAGKKAYESMGGKSDAISWVPTGAPGAAFRTRGLDRGDRRDLRNI
jgi:hypothetical protein